MAISIKNFHKKYKTSRLGPPPIPPTPPYPPLPPDPPIPPIPGEFSMGLNLSGAENPFPTFVNLDEMAYYATTKNIKFFRLPLLWQDIQPTLNGALDPTYMASISAVLAKAASVGATVLIDIHSSGRRPEGLIGTDFAVSCLVDTWTKMSSYFLTDPHYNAISGYDIMNEWHDMDPNTPGTENSPYSQNLMLSIYQQIITALRNNLDAKLVHVEGLHYSGAWDWVTNNGGWITHLVDPSNNFLVHVHCYLDNDSSGTNFVWSVEAAKPGAAPPGLPTSHTIGPARMADVTTFCQAHNLRMCLGETGWSSDWQQVGGADDYADWNIAGQNMLQFCHDNKIMVFGWGAGPGFSPISYAYAPAPSNVQRGLANTKDFTTTGLQAPQMVIFDKFTPFTGSQPLAYRVDTPYGVTPYAPSGTAITGFKLRYYGKITSTITFTGHDTLPDGSSAGGSSISVTLSPGDNGIATFSYTPSGSHAQININFTNNAGLINPPQIGASSVQDIFQTNSVTPKNVFALRRMVNSYAGPALTLINMFDSSTQDFYFNNRGDLPREDIQDWALSRTIGVKTIYDQSINANNMQYNGGTYATLILVNSDGYPEINFADNTHYVFEYSVGPQDAVGTTAQTIYARISDGNAGSTFISNDNISPAGATLFPFRFSPSTYSVNNETPSLTTSPPSGYHTYAGTFAANTSGGLKKYIDASNTQSTDTPAGGLIEGQDHTYVGYFTFYNPIFWTGKWTSLFTANQTLTGAQITAFNSADTTYYGIALPDPLNPFNPVAPAETPYAAPGGTFTPINMKGTNLAGGDQGYPSANQFNYAYPQDMEIDYYAAKGFGCIRMPVQTRRMQPQSYGRLDPAGRLDELPNAYRTFTAPAQTNMLSIKAVLDRALSHNMYVILDLHNFGTILDTLTGTNRTIGADSEATNQFVDIWQRLATKFKNYPNIIWGLENEPVGMTVSQWFTAATAAINAIAAITTAQTVLIPGGANFTGAHDWVTSGNAAAWAGYTPPTGLPIIFEMHQYLDSDNSGTHTTVVAGKGATVLADATAWLVTNGFKALLGEVGWSANDSQPSGGTPSVEGAAIMAYMSAHPTQWKGWTYWVGGESLFYNAYMYNTVPTGYPTGPFTDTAQMSILTANI